MTDPIATPFRDVIHPLKEEEHPPVLIDASPDGAVVVRINRPHRKNAFDVATIDALREAFTTLHSADGVRVVFVRGEGGAFSAGADLDWMREAAGWSEEDNREDALGLAHMLKALYDIPALTVALVEGAAFGGGAGLVAACDIAIATADAKFAFSEVKLGLTPATISPYVVRAIGPRASRVLFATGRVFGAEEALRWGLVQEVVQGADRLNALETVLMDAMKACAPEAIGEAKRLVDLVYGQPIDRSLIEETARRIAARRVGTEGQEGVTAFLEKRKPNWAV
jgi:methylglutaconyl-CoA hydratase